VIKAPAFVVGAPCVGTELLSRALERGPGVAHTARWRVPPRGEDVAGPHGLDRLDRSDVPELGQAAAQSLGGWLCDRSGNPIDSGARCWRPVVAGGPVALQIPFLADVFPSSRFVLVLRDAGQAVAELAEAWRCGFWISAESWTGSPWSMPLIPGWEEPAGAKLEERIAERWLAIADTALDDLAELKPERWAVTELDTLVQHPAAELSRLCGFLDIGYDPAMIAPLRTGRTNTESRPG
jgi:hypothetical protein